ncbi:hypothetical protein RJ639_042358 [Escallonia herrerae]|uniref:Retrotransposon gag domain-containing protein n=1 Tax=Escallonia herrerae TaxID=1293975 RepID=A0AA88WKF7_9ASTE|nr:hypothetical protein RJ639_042358 [Escallonia herrerae]
MSCFPRDVKVVEVPTTAPPPTDPSSSAQGPTANQGSSGIITRWHQGTHSPNPSVPHISRHTVYVSSFQLGERVEHDAPTLRVGQEGIPEKLPIGVSFFVFAGTSDQSRKSAGRPEDNTRHAEVRRKPVCPAEKEIRYDGHRRVRMRLKPVEDGVVELGHGAHFSDDFELGGRRWVWWGENQGLEGCRGLQAAIENLPPQSGPHRPLGTSKTPEQTSHIRHVTQTAEESDDERRNPRSRRQEENYYEAQSTRNTYANTGGNRAERYSNAPIIIGRPFTEEIDLFPTPLSFKMPSCESYDGTGDPMEHLARFTSGMNLHLVPDQIMCRAFPVTLKGAVHVWFQHLLPRSIFCWAQLAESFRSNYLTSRVQRKNSSTLFCIIQGPKESLKSYYARFNSEKLLIDHLDPGVTFAAMARGVRLGTPLRFSLNKRPPENMSDLLDRVEKYLRAEEDSMTSHQEEIHSGQKRRDRLERKNQDEPKCPRALISKSFTPLNITREHIVHQIKGQNIIKWPKPMRGPVERRDTQVYSHFHKDHGHKMEECKVLQREIENLIAKGHFKQFVKNNNRQQTGGRNNPRRVDEAPPKDPHVIKHHLWRT